ncbi:MAG: CheY-like chemotaxis protein [Candidatus Azotimanducaceae bacterium]|jgi:CheY-like chemotaxis protein
MPYLLQATTLILLPVVTMALLFAVWHQKHWQQLYELNPLPLFRLNPALQLEHCNLAFAHLLGYRNSRECLVLYNAYPHDVGLNTALLDALTGLKQDSPETTKDVTLISRFGDPVVRRVTLLRSLPRGRFDLCLLVQTGNMTEPEDFEHLLQQPLLPAFLLDKNLCIEAFNTQAETHFVATLGESLETLFAAKDRQRVTALVKRRLTGKSRAELSFAGLLKHQETRDCKWYFVRVTHGADRMLVLCNVAPRPSLLVPALDRVIQGPWGLWTLDLVQQTLRLSDNWRQMLGSEGGAASEALGWWREIVAPQDQQRVFDAMVAYLRTPALGFCLRHQMAGPNGVLHRVSSQAIQIDRTESGEVLRVIGMHRLSDTRESGVRDDSPRYGEPLDPGPWDTRDFRHDVLNQMAVVEGHLGLLRHNRTIPDALYQTVRGMGEATVHLRELLQCTLNQAHDPRAGRGANTNNPSTDQASLMRDPGAPDRQPESGLKWLLRWVEQYHLHEARPWLLVHDPVPAPLYGTLHEPHDPLHVTGDSAAPAPLLPAECCVCGLAITPGPWCQIEWRQPGRLIAQQGLTYLFDARTIGAWHSTESGAKENGDDIRLLPALAEKIHEQGGHLQLEVTSQQSRLSVYLPLLSAAPPNSTMADAQANGGRVVSKSDGGASPRHGAERIMVVDDQPAVSSYLNILLTDAGYHVSVFNNPRQALNILRRSPSSTDLIITDQQMPDLTGDAIIQAMGQLRPNLPIILCSGYSDDAWSASGRAIEVIGKPVDPDALFASLNRLLLTTDS